MALTYEQVLKQIRDAGIAQQDADIKASDNLYDQQIAQVGENYGQQIQQTRQQYGELYDQAAVQNAINERQIRESMANAGLTDSGLNRTQLTANELSKGNAYMRISRQQQQAVDTLASTMRAQITQLQGNKAAAAEQIRSGYDEAARKQAASYMETQEKTAADLQKAQISAEQSAAKERDKAYNTLMGNIMSTKYTDEQKRVLADDFGRKYGLSEDEAAQLNAAAKASSSAKTYTPDQYSVDYFSGMTDSKARSAMSSALRDSTISDAKKLAIFNNYVKSSGLSSEDAQNFLVEYGYTLTNDGRIVKRNSTGNPVVYDYDKATTPKTSIRTTEVESREASRTKQAAASGKPVTKTVTSRKGKVYSTVDQISKAKADGEIDENEAMDLTYKLIFS